MIQPVDLIQPAILGGIVVALVGFYYRDLKAQLDKAEKDKEARIAEVRADTAEQLRARDDVIAKQAGELAGFRTDSAELLAARAEVDRLQAQNMADMLSLVAALGAANPDRPK